MLASPYIDVQQGMMEQGVRDPGEPMTGAALRWRMILLAGFLYYAVILIWGAELFAVPRPPLDLTFNSMLDHLLRGEFDVDPAMVGDEGFTRGGHVYAYWGIWPALLRLPLVVVPGWIGINVTALSCLVAVTTALAAKLWTLVRVTDGNNALPGWLAATMATTLVLSGAQIGFLRPSLYQEVCLWAGAFGAVFVAGAIMTIRQGFQRRWLAVMALACTGALLTRVSVAIGLMAALAMLLAVDMVKDRRAFAPVLRRWWGALAIVALGIAITAVINIGRWGNATTFADYSYYNLNQLYPDRLDRTALYGLFNVQRLPFGLLYYLFPIWVLHGSDGQLLFSGIRDRLIDSAELPPSSFLLTDPLLLTLGAMTVVGWWRRRDEGVSGVLVMLGLAGSPLLMLAAISMCYRYRIDFYPLIEFAAFSGLMMWARPGWSTLPKRLAWSLTMVSILGAHAALLLYLLSDSGPVQLHLTCGIVEYYTDRASRVF